MADPYLGEIRLIAFNYAPSGWFLCQGQTLSIQQYQALFTLLGTTYGGNGQSTFQLPNLQSRVPIGVGQGPGLSTYILGQTGGQEQVTLSQGQLPQHTHAATFTPGGGGTPLSVNVAINASTGAGNSVAASGASLASYPQGGSSHGSGIFTTTPGTTAPLSGVVTTVSGGGSGGGTVTNALAGGSLPTPVIQPYLALNYIIAWQGIFPPRP